MQITLESITFYLFFNKELEIGMKSMLNFMIGTLGDEFGTSI